MKEIGRYVVMYLADGRNITYQCGSAETQESRYEKLRIHWVNGELFYLNDNNRERLIDPKYIVSIEKENVVYFNSEK